ncbi:MAG TPA: hypothetical protein IGS53_00295 [Leptolyngbyaceae cyanobacterium M33_DOE_097]|uniref:Uncharacterized protein n=1 Tax=Oscillatoriales cyanobacterium SpSt-418 TaxID=2282169 RepID=A0A7C3PGP8_9CYAN|nr:hypothetical protein [Leptolyngbyaceae cyanobacterium M33_DOE_097]
MSELIYNPVEPTEADLQVISSLVYKAAYQRKADSVQLLALLRLLEGLHQEIRDTLFQAALPSSRHSLYGLLRDIETHGGWPYIHRMKLHDLLQNYPEFLEEAQNMMFDREEISSDGELTPE